MSNWTLMINQYLPRNHGNSQQRHVDDTQSTLHRRINDISTFHIILQVLAHIFGNVTRFTTFLFIYKLTIVLSTITEHFHFRFY